MGEIRRRLPGAFGARNAGEEWLPRECIVRARAMLAPKESPAKQTPSQKAGCFDIVLYRLESFGKATGAGELGARG